MSNPPFEPALLVDCYNTTLAELLDRHAPLKTKTVTVRRQEPWYSEEIREAKRARRRAERKWRKTRGAASCCLDPIPTHLLKSCSGPLIPVITKIINNSLELGIFPECWKEAIVIPLLKKTGTRFYF